jgi:AcrR family transcriptional regulator
VGVAVESTRRRLTDRQAATVARLTDACVEELREQGFDRLTVRNVARRAGVAPATAYTYFTSKEHLVSEVFWRRLVELPDSALQPDEPLAVRLQRTIRELTLLVADEPALAAACTVAMLSSDPDVALLRERIGAEWRRRLLAAADGAASDDAIDAIELAMGGALVRAGTGHLTYADLPDLLGRVINLLVGDR